MIDNIITWLNTPIGIRYTKQGGMRFLRVGRYQFSFCKCRQGI